MCADVNVFDFERVGEKYPELVHDFPGGAPRYIQRSSGYAATLVNGGISTFDPNGGVEHIAFPDALVTNICFGGADMRDAWITASGAGKLLKCRWPRPWLRLNFNA